MTTSRPLTGPSRQGDASCATRLVIGCGYLGLRVAREWLKRGDAVWALTRSHDHTNEFERDGITPLVGDVMHPASLACLPSVDTVLYAVGFDKSAPFSKRDVYVDGLRNVLNVLPEDCGRLIYVSSTSVYGQSQGEWIDETSPCRPTTAGGRICLDAEQWARSATSFGGGVTVLRLSGIYGPGRLAARVDALRRHQPISAHAEGWVNLIHVEDAARVVLTAADLQMPLDTLLVSDDQPLLRRDYYTMLAAAVGTPPPVFDGSADEGRGKRCSNRKLHSLPGVRLSYPTLAEGLPTVVY